MKRGRPSTESRTERARNYLASVSVRTAVGLGRQPVEADETDSLRAGQRRVVLNDYPVRCGRASEGIRR